MLRRGSKSSRQWHGPQNHHITALTIFLVLVLFISVILFRKEESPSSLVVHMEQKLNSSESSIQLQPTIEYKKRTDVIWQIPDTPKAVLFLAHGCHGRAVNFWDNSLKCPKCVGLPEERLIVLHALARKFAVLAVSSAGRCWSFGEERLIVKGIIQWWVKKKKFETLPLLALGASSGGNFVSVLARDLRFNSIVLMIAAGVFSHGDVPEDYPPTLFVHMPKDRFTMRKIDENLEFFRHKGIVAEDVKCMELPLTPTFLAERIPSLDETVSVKLYELFRDKGFIDKKGYMKNDGRMTNWKQALKKSEILLPDKHLLNHIQEEMNLAFAYHEMTSLQSEQIFKWFEAHMN